MPTSARRGPGRPPAAKSAETRGRILATAREVFSELGYDAATFQQIAERAQLTRPAINHYFPGKRALYQEVVEQTSQFLLDAGAAEALRAGTFADRIQAFITAAVDAQRRDPSAAAFLMTSVLDSRRHPELTDGGQDALGRIRRFVEESLDRARADGEVAPDIDAATLAEAVLAMLLGLGFYAGFIGSAERLPGVTDHFRALLSGQVFRRGA